MIFWIVRWVKGQKIGQNEKLKLHLSHIVSQEQAHNHDFVHLCKMMISPGFFLLFQNFDFSGHREEAGWQKGKWSKMTKTSVQQAPILGTIRHMIVIYGTHV